MRLCGALGKLQGETRAQQSRAPVPASPLPSGGTGMVARPPAPVLVKRRGFTFATSYLKITQELGLEVGQFGSPTRVAECHFQDLRVSAEGL